jgi:hypothetical protein
MKRNILSKIFLLSLFVVGFNNTHAQWAGLANGVVDTSISDGVYAIATSGSNVYVGGSFAKVNTTVNASNVAVWNGTTWSALGLGLNGYVYALAIVNGNLYAAGNFTKSGTDSLNRIAKWNPTLNIWTPLGIVGGNKNGVNGAVYTLAVFGGKLFIGGFFSSYYTTTGSTVPASKVVIWDDATSTFTTAGSGPGGNVLSFAVHGSPAKLYAGCYTNVVSEWNGSTWTAIGNPALGTTGGNYATALASFQGNLYASGIFTSNNNIAKWNGTSWSAVGTGFPTNQYAKALEVYANSLVAGGNFQGAGGNSSLIYLARWTGSAWATTNTSPNQEVWAMDTAGTPGQTIYVGGNFNYGGFSQIMKHSGPIGIEEVELPKSSVSIYPNPTHGKITVAVNVEVKKPYVEIYNILGDRIFSRELIENKLEINAGNFVAGIYFVKIISAADNRVLTQKLVIE